jgi:hypothetical protein
MKKALALGIGIIGLVAMASVARADQPAKQEGRVWIDQNFVLAFTPEWSLTTMPGARVEYARTREGSAGLQFIELFFGPNYTRRWTNFTLKVGLWYYYMGYPGRDRLVETSKYDGSMTCSSIPAAGVQETTCRTSTYNFSHNIEVVPSAEYRFGKWSVYDRVILHNTFYADTYNTPQTLGDGSVLSVDDQRWGFGTVLRELLQLRYAVTDKLGVFVSDELFFGIHEDSDTSKITSMKGYRPTGYWKNGFRSNRTYLGFDYKVAPNFTIAPMYMIDMTMKATDSTDVTDVVHNIFIVGTITAALFEPKK